ncbi:MAG TPA: DUF3368 domain-containing protein [Phycisphaerae bacterium]|nr:DUF3368 domain-containing protein [Phycisphaerae bacterium]
MIVVSDTSPLVALQHLGKVDLLRALFEEVLVPPAVVAELARGTEKWPAVDLSPYPFVRIRSPQRPQPPLNLRVRIDPGEQEAIALALELHADLLLVDDKSGREAAREVGLQHTGTLGVLLRAKSMGFVPLIRPLLDRLVEDIDFYLSREVRDVVLQQAREQK